MYNIYEKLARYIFDLARKRNKMVTNLGLSYSSIPSFICFLSISAAAGNSLQ